MPRLYLTTRRGIAVADGSGERWEGRLALADQDCRCVAVDPFAPERVYCGTAGGGLWRSEDAGATWQQAAGRPHASVTALAISRRERELDACAIYAGTAPSGLFRSGNGGLTWEERPALREVPSAER
ncbi:MAG TPA: hypothetical protein VGE07_02030, partial [Herpetosiphonaceae bacterium]